MEQQHGLLVLNKPRGLSSAQCLSRLKRIGQRKIGHAGTLDPMAEGVLLVLLGQATKLSGYLMRGGVKVYRGTAELGRVTDTWDAEGRELETRPWDAVCESAVRAEIAAWQGSSEQEVPPYSAAKHQGQPLYKLSRAGKETPIKRKVIDIAQAEVLRVELPFVTFRVVCSSGTYIRSLAHSLGMRLGCGAVLTELTREYSHPFGLDQACPLDALLAEPERLAERLLPLAAALPDWPLIQMDARGEAAVRNGVAVPDPAADFVRPLGSNAVLLATDGRPLALAQAAPGGVWQVLRGLWL